MPFLAAQQLGLDSAPKRFHHGVVEGRADLPHGRRKTRVLDFLAEGPGRKLLEFQESSQHPEHGGVHEAPARVDEVINWEEPAGVARSAGLEPRNLTGVLAEDRRG